MNTLDTNILVYYAANEPAIAAFLIQQLENKQVMYLPTIVAVEFLAFPPLQESDRRFFIQLMRQLRIISLDFDIALKAADLKAKFGLKLGDSVVAATAIATSTTLLTRNVRDFRKVEGLKLKSL